MVALGHPERRGVGGLPAGVSGALLRLPPLPAGSEIVLADSDGNGLLTFTTEKAAQSLIFSSADLKQDVDYTLTVGTA